MCITRNDADNHDEIRQAIVSYIESNAEYFKLFMEDDESIDQYIRRMKSCYEWGGHQELYAASQCFDTNIVIHQLHCPDYIIQAKSLKSSTTTIHLSYHGECHYNSVIMLDSNKGVINADDVITTTRMDRRFDEGIVDMVALSVPWVGREYVLSALSSNDGDVDAAVDWLCTHTNEHCSVITTAKDEETISNCMSSHDISNKDSTYNKDKHYIRPDIDEYGGSLVVTDDDLILYNDHDEEAVHLHDLILASNVSNSLDELSVVVTATQTLSIGRVGHAHTATSTSPTMDGKRVGGKVKSRPLKATAHQEVATSSDPRPRPTVTLSKKVYQCK